MNVTVDRRDYLYRHTNGEVIRKPCVVVQMAGGPFEYFDSPFVRHWWRDGENEPGYDLSQEDRVAP
jgi:hypothetical protein